MYHQLDKSKPCPFPLPATATYLGETEAGYYHMDGFFDGITNMFKRMVKFTPKSFTASNIMKGFTNTTVGIASGGLAYLAPKSIRKTIFKVGEIAVPVIAAGAVAAAVAPSVMTALSSKLSTAGSLLGKNASSIGGSLFKAISGLNSADQAAVAQQVTPQDIVYAEQHNGEFPPSLQAHIDQASQMQYAYAQDVKDGSQYYASSSLYPGLIPQYEQALARAQQGSDGTDWSPAVTVGAMAGGTLLLILLLRK